MKSWPRAILETEQGKAEMYLVVAFLKKRLHRNRERAIILAKGSELVLHVFIYTKQDISDIIVGLAGFRELAKHYAFWQKAN